MLYKTIETSQVKTDKKKSLFDVGHGLYTFRYREQ